MNPFQVGAANEKPLIDTMLIVRWVWRQIGVNGQN